jgi:hypothetical protein
VAFVPSELTLRTSPTIRPRSFTSDGGASWLPTLSVSRVTCTTSMNAFWYVAMLSPISSAITSRNTTP